MPIAHKYCEGKVKSTFIPRVKENVKFVLLRKGTALLIGIKLVIGK